jgi:hypothetical protein
MQPEAIIECSPKPGSLQPLTRTLTQAKSGGRTPTTLQRGGRECSDFQWSLCWSRRHLRSRGVVAARYRISTSARREPGRMTNTLALQQLGTWDTLPSACHSARCETTQMSHEEKSPVPCSRGFHACLRGRPEVFFAIQQNAGQRVHQEPCVQLQLGSGQGSHQSVRFCHHLSSTASNSQGFPRPHSCPTGHV